MLLADHDAADDDSAAATGFGPKSWHVVGGVCWRVHNLNPVLWRTNSLGLPRVSSCFCNRKRARKRVLLVSRRLVCVVVTEEGGV